PHPAGAGQSPLERRQALTARQRRRDPRRTGGRLGARLGHRSRPGHSAGLPGPRLRKVRPGRRLLDPPQGRHRSRPHHLQGDHRTARRPALVRNLPGGRNDVLLHPAGGGAGGIGGRFTEALDYAANRKTGVVMTLTGCASPQTIDWSRSTVSGEKKRSPVRVDTRAGTFSTTMNFSPSCRVYVTCCSVNRSSGRSLDIGCPPVAVVDPALWVWLVHGDDLDQRP